MTEILTAAQMRAIEGAAISSGEVTGLELMERAGHGVVSAVLEEWPELRDGAHKAVVLCGPGNNGGDGFVVARLLKDRGWDVQAFLLGDPQKLPPDAKENYERWQTLGTVAPLHGSLEPSQCRAALVVDALFGTGLTRPIEGFGTLFLDLHHSQGPGTQFSEAERPMWCPRLVAVDLPSGVCSDSGRVLAPASFRGLPGKLEAASACADLTVSFHAFKRGHFLSDGPILCGKTVVKSIGLKPTASTKASEALRIADERGLNRMGKRAGDHKYAHGHALILTGGSGRTGAARLAGRGALRIGAGLVTLGVPPSAQQEVACQITALMLTRVDGAEGLAEVLRDSRLNAVCLGPGLGFARARELAPVVCRGVEPRPTILDADALMAFEDAPDTLFGLLHGQCILTPHGGEFARLFPDIAETLNAPATQGPAFSKVDATRAAAKRAGCVVLFKGADTVIATPDGQCSINSAHYERAAPWLATAGAGDVLAGFITGLVARGFPPFEAAEAAARLHVECARRFGPGLIAEDLPEQVPHVLRELAV